MTAKETFTKLQKHLFCTTLTENLLKLFIALQKPIILWIHDKYQCFCLILIHYGKPYICSIRIKHKNKTTLQNNLQFYHRLWKRGQSSVYTFKVTGKQIPLFTEKQRKQSDNTGRKKAIRFVFVFHFYNTFIPTFAVDHGRNWNNEMHSHPHLNIQIELSSSEK